MSEATTDENLQRFASSPYAPSWQKEVVADLYAARERIRQLEYWIKRAEPLGCGRTMGNNTCPWCAESANIEFGSMSVNLSPIQHSRACVVFNSDGTLK